MFEVGKNYEFVMSTTDGEVHFSGTVEKYEHPLLKLADHVFEPGHPFLPKDSSGWTHHGKIINVTSRFFVSAQLKDA